MAKVKKRRMNTSIDVRRYLAEILYRLECGHVDVRTAEALSNIAYKIQMSIAGEQKQREIDLQEQLAERLEQVRR